MSILKIHFCSKHPGQACIQQRNIVPSMRNNGKYRFLLLLSSSNSCRLLETCLSIISLMKICMNWLILWAAKKLHRLQLVQRVCSACDENVFYSFILSRIWPRAKRRRVRKKNAVDWMYSLRSFFYFIRSNNILYSTLCLLLFFLKQQQNSYIQNFHVIWQVKRTLYCL